jgi:hypothetical protein
MDSVLFPFRKTDESLVLFSFRKTEGSFVLISFRKTDESFVLFSFRKTEGSERKISRSSTNQLIADVANGLAAHFEGQS